jgi:hypothetical protein
LLENQNLLEFDRLMQVDHNFLELLFFDQVYYLDH